ncbi:MAG: DUF3108 domain-containing protein [Blastocatellia bacterium]|nr:DUF3108 domain-containing protein [Blastocatellia bacterium]
MRHLLTFFSLIAFALLVSFSAYSQSLIQLPFAAGESLVYEAKIGRFKLSTSVSDLVFTVDRTPDPNRMLIKSRAESRGTLVKLFRFSFLQEIESIVDFSQSRVLKTTKHDVQKKRVRDSVAAFDYTDRRVSFTETDPNDPRRPPRRIGSEIGSEMHDLITAIYSLRTLQLKVGSRFEMPISDSGLVYKIPVRVTAREHIRTVIGRVWCWRVEPVIFGPGRMIDQKGSMTLWLTDDARRVPVRAELRTTYGEIEVKLKTAQFGSMP